MIGPQGRAVVELAKFELMQAENGEVELVGMFGGQRAIISRDPDKGTVVRRWTLRVEGKVFQLPRGRRQVKAPVRIDDGGFPDRRG